MGADGSECLATLEKELFNLASLLVQLCTFDLEKSFFSLYMSYHLKVLASLMDWSQDRPDRGIRSDTRMFNLSIFLHSRSSAGSFTETLPVNGVLVLASNEEIEDYNSGTCFHPMNDLTPLMVSRYVCSSLTSWSQSSDLADSRLYTPPSSSVVKRGEVGSLSWSTSES